jgi:hypothetical protein
VALESPFCLPSTLDDQAAAAQAPGMAQQAAVPTARPPDAGEDREACLCGEQGERAQRPDKAGVVGGEAECVDGETRERGHLTPDGARPVEIEAQTIAVPPARSRSAASVSTTGETGDGDTDDKTMQEALRMQVGGEGRENLAGDGAGRATPQEREEDEEPRSSARGRASATMMASAIAFGGFIAECL